MCEVSNFISGWNWNCFSMYLMNELCSEGSRNSTAQMIDLESS